MLQLRESEDEKVRGKKGRREEKLRGEGEKGGKEGENSRGREKGRTREEKRTELEKRVKIREERRRETWTYGVDNHRQKQHGEENRHGC